MAHPKREPVTMPRLDPKQIGQRIRSVRKGRGWDLYDLAQISGIRRGTIACYECGARIPIRDNVIKLSLALRRTMEFLLFGKHTRRRKPRMK